jgi:UDP-N-acetyl-alpha-D-quinovosamine dehydrogenase
VTRPLPTSVLVTGANGFLGTHIVGALLSRGVAVRGLVRRRDAALPPGANPAVVADLDDLPGIRRAVEGVEGVVHLAARVHLPDGEAAVDAAMQVNREGTRHLVDASVAAGVRDFVFASSVKTVGEQSHAPWTEAVLPAPADAYGRSKLEAEALVAAGRIRGLHAPILRLPLVYGPGMKANALRLFQVVDTGLPLPLGGIRNRRSLLYTGNLIAAVIAVLSSPRGNDLFFVTDDDDVSMPELVRAVAEALGIQPRLLPAPERLLRWAVALGDRLPRFRGFPLPTGSVDRLFGSLAVSCAHLREATGYTPPFRLREGLRETAAWYARERVA